MTEVKAKDQLTEVKAKEKAPKRDVTKEAKDKQRYLVLQDETIFDGKMYKIGDIVHLTDQEASAARERGQCLGKAPKEK